MAVKGMPCIDARQFDAILRKCDGFARRKMEE